MGYCPFSSSSCDTGGLYHDRQGTGARQGLTGPGLHVGARARHDAAALQYGAIARATWPGLLAGASGLATVVSRHDAQSAQHSAATQRPVRNDTAPSAWCA